MARLSTNPGTPRRAYVSPPPIAHPTPGAYASAHQPSSTLMWSACRSCGLHPARARPSCGRRGVFNHTSVPCTSTGPAPCRGPRGRRVATGTEGRATSGDRLMNSLPGWSCGMRLAAKMNCTGRCGSETRRASRSVSVKRRTARLYVANRRANPTVSDARVEGLVPPSRPPTARPRGGAAAGAASARVEDKPLAARLVRPPQLAVPGMWHADHAGALHARPGSAPMYVW